MRYQCSKNVTEKCIFSNSGQSSIAFSWSIPIPNISVERVCNFLFKAVHKKKAVLPWPLSGDLSHVPAQVSTEYSRVFRFRLGFRARHEWSGSGRRDLNA